MELCLVTQSCQYLLSGSISRQCSQSFVLICSCKAAGSDPWENRCKLEHLWTVCPSVTGWLGVQCTSPAFPAVCQDGMQECTKEMQWLERNLSELTPLWSVTVLQSLLWDMTAFWHCGPRKQTRQSTDGNVWELYICWISEMLNGL